MFVAEIIRTFDIVGTSVNVGKAAFSCVHSNSRLNLHLTIYSFRWYMALLSVAVSAYSAGADMKLTSEYFTGLSANPQHDKGRC